MVKHTSEPWELLDDPSAGYYEIWAGGTHIADVCSTKADAQLMTAAPTMYAALRWVLDHSRDECVEQYGMVMAALDQAEGRA
jgi:hypothetical protein